MCTAQREAVDREEEEAVVDSPSSCARRSRRQRRAVQAQGSTAGGRVDGANGRRTQEREDGMAEALQARRRREGRRGSLQSAFGLGEHWAARAAHKSNGRQARGEPVN